MKKYAFVLFVVLLSAATALASSDDRGDSYFSIIKCTAKGSPKADLAPAQFDIMGIVGFPNTNSRGLVVGDLKTPMGEVRAAQNYYIGIEKQSDGKFSVRLNFHEAAKRGHMGSIKDLEVGKPAVCLMGAEQDAYDCQTTPFFAEYVKYVFKDEK